MTKGGSAPRSPVIASSASLEVQEAAVPTKLWLADRRRRSAESAAKFAVRLTRPAALRASMKPLFAAARRLPTLAPSSTPPHASPRGLATASSRTPAIASEERIASRTSCSARGESLASSSTGSRPARGEEGGSLARSLASTAAAADTYSAAR
eukprot:CAMPEP_0196696534 /NCGR_PEP_ID=MMETSP1090-20130531/39611_1 /TAXON_ID=37098 /ORGANISM="Isochrysis sp, Strain CCMP1244" /LENGTH=152 /DNA_ID=CAMNT_0042036131 /DNA_START=114 /DNA_END=572 /DNA_ORIENTATION=-